MSPNYPVEPALLPVITGVGLVTSIANDLKTLCGALADDRTLPSTFPTLFSEDDYPYAALPASFPRECSHADILDHCLDQVLQMSGLSLDELQHERTALILGAVSGLQPRWHPGMPPASLHVAAPADSFSEGHLAERMAVAWGMRGPRYTVGTACASSASAVVLAATLLQARAIDRAIVGAADILTWFDVHGFRSARLLSRSQARPFDRNRRGLMLGEGGGLVLLELPSSLRKPLASLRGWASRVERGVATPEESGETLSRCIGDALTIGDVPVHDVGYVNAHAPGTPANDISEARALARLWNPQAMTIIGSTKGLHGHLRAAAGVVELIVVVAALMAKVAPPTFGCLEPDPGCAWRLALGQPVHQDMVFGTSISRGFGGVNVVLVIERREHAFDARR